MRSILATATALLVLGTGIVPLAARTDTFPGWLCGLFPMICPA